VVRAEERTEVEVAAEDESALNTTGNVFSIDADTFSVTPEKVTIPLNFMYNSKTVFVDESDKSIPWEQMRAGLPVTVNYSTIGEKMLATKVVTTRWMIDGAKKEADPADEAGRKRERLAESKKKKDADSATQRAVTAATTGGGTIMGFEQVIAVRPQGSADVVQYVINNSTHYVDTSGQPVSLNLVRTGLPVSIQFVDNGGRKIATRIVLQALPQGVSTSTPATGKNNQSIASRTFGAGTPGATTSSGGGTSIAGVPGTLEEGFINPPIVSVAGTLGTTATTGSTTGATGSPTTGQTGTNQTGTGPSATQPAVAPPATRQPDTTQPNTKPAGSGSTPSKPSSTPPTPSNSSAPAPGRR